MDEDAPEPGKREGTIGYALGKGQEEKRAAPNASSNGHTSFPRDLALRLTLVQQGIITTEQLDETERILASAAGQHKAVVLENGEVKLMDPSDVAKKVADDANALAKGPVD